jgi:hypothetical protein
VKKDRQQNPLERGQYFSIDLILVSPGNDARSGSFIQIECVSGAEWAVNPPIQLRQDKTRQGDFASLATIKIVSSY